jgi:hypothetical protein
VTHTSFVRGDLERPCLPRTSVFATVEEIAGTYPPSGASGASAWLLLEKKLPGFDEFLRISS